MQAASPVDSAAIADEPSSSDPIVGNVFSAAKEPQSEGVMTYLTEKLPGLS
jgi:hypothetical protein